MRIWVLVESKPNPEGPVRNIYTNYESAMMAWSSEAADGEREDAIVFEGDGIYSVTSGNDWVVMQEVEL